MAFRHGDFIMKLTRCRRVNMKFLKRMLSVRPQTVNVAVYGELGEDGSKFSEKRDN